MALHYDPIRIKSLAISSSCAQDIILFQDLHLARPTHLLLSSSPPAPPALRRSPEIPPALWEGPLHIDPHYLCRVSGSSRTQHFLDAVRATGLSRAASLPPPNPLHPSFAIPEYSSPSLPATATGNLCWPPAGQRLSAPGWCHIFRCCKADSMASWPTRCSFILLDVLFKNSVLLKNRGNIVINSIKKLKKDK